MSRRTLAMLMLRVMETTEAWIVITNLVKKKTKVLYHIEIQN